MFFRCPHNPGRQLKIVVSGGLGDCLLATPFIRHFRQSDVYAYEKIVCAVTWEAAEIFDCNPYIDQMVICKGNDLFLWALPERDCDVFSPYLDVRPAERKGASLVGVHAEYILNPNRVGRPIVRQVADHHGIAVQDVGPQLFTSEADELWAETFIRPFGQASLILITPFSRLSEKNLPQPLAQEIIDRLRPHFLILELAAGEAVFNGTVPVSPLEGLRKSASLFKHLDCIITVDSFPAHLAAAVGSRAVVLFGPSNPETFGHPTNLNLRPSTCPPCADTSRRAACKKSVCMEEISPERVVDAVNTVLSEAVALEGAPSATQI